MKYLLGVDIGSSSVKCALVAIDSGECVASAFSPSSEMKIVSPEKGFAEQDPNLWWDELCNAMSLLANEYAFDKDEIAAIGIGHNVGDFYHNSITVKNIEELGDVMIDRICELL